MLTASGPWPDLRRSDGADEELEPWLGDRMGCEAGRRRVQVPARVSVGSARGQHGAGDADHVGSALACGRKKRSDGPPDPTGGSPVLPGAEGRQAVLATKW